MTDTEEQEILRTMDHLEIQAVVNLTTYRDGGTLGIDVAVVGDEDKAIHRVYVDRRMISKTKNRCSWNYPRTDAIVLLSEEQMTQLTKLLGRVE